MAIYGLRLHTLGQSVYYCAEEDLSIGDKVLVMEDERLCIATVTQGPLDIEVLNAAHLPSIVRVATEEDILDDEENLRLEKAAYDFCLDCIHARQLDMKLVDVHVFFDKSKIIFFFTAPTRIDFRELVKDLVRQYHTRIELRQIGVRHETQMVGAIGNCGQICCCRRYLRSFAPVTIRMAKEQNLFLNPSKISGSCGRLLCCLSYEQENYDNFFSKSPRAGKKYTGKNGTLKVIRTNLFRNTVSFVNDANEESEVSLDEWLRLVPNCLENSTHADDDHYDICLDDVPIDDEVIDEFAYQDAETSYKKLTELVESQNKTNKKKEKKKKYHKNKKH